MGRNQHQRARPIEPRFKIPNNQESNLNPNNQESNLNPNNQESRTKNYEPRPSNEGRLKGPGFKIQTKTKDQGSKAMSQKPQTITKTQRLSFQIQKTKTANKGSRNEVEEPKKCKPKGRIEEAKTKSRNQHYGPRVKDE